MNRLTQRITQWVLVLVLIVASLGARADMKAALPDPPNPPRLVNDFGHFLQPDQIEALEQKLRAFNDSTSSQIAVITVTTLEDYDVDEYANALYRKWGIGQAKKNNGVLLLASKQDRKIRIEVGYGLEGALPDAICNQIIDLSVVPNFKSGNFYQGFDQATDDIMAATRNEYKAEGGGGGGGGIITALLLFGVIMIIIISISRKSRTFMSRRGSRNWDDWGGPPWMGGGFGGFGGGSSGGGFGGGGGGFGGFGGGSSGGGGASGSW